jgi:hypothetical protein
MSCWVNIFKWIIAVIENATVSILGNEQPAPYPTTDVYSCIENIMHGYNTGSLEATRIYIYQMQALALIDNSAPENGAGCSFPKIETVAFSITRFPI